MPISKSVLLVFSDDLFFTPHFEDVARSLGFQFRLVEKASDIGAQGQPAARELALTEPLEGPDAALIKNLVEKRPAMILVDTSSQSIPWQRWIQVIKSSAATRRIPIVAFGPHVDKDILQAASDAGSDYVVSRGKIQKSLLQIIEQWALVPDQAAIHSDCQDELSSSALEGLKLLNRGEYFQAHEHLEVAWKDSQAYLLRALVQVSVIYLHVGRANYRGALKMLLRVRQWIDPLPDECQGIDVAAIRDNLAQLHLKLEKVGPQGMETIDPELLKPIRA